MRFSSIAVLALLAPVANAFAPIQRQYSAPRTVLKANVEYDLDLGIEEVPKPKKGGKKTAPAPVPVPVPEPVAAPKSKRRSAAKKVVEAPPPAPVPVEKKRKVKKVKTTPVPPPPPPSSVKKVKTVSSASTASTSTKASGVALGAAPLVLAPVVLLGAGRSLLQGTKARREKIQKEVDDFEKSKKKKTLQADVDGGDLAKAVVR